MIVEIIIAALLAKGTIEACKMVAEQKPAEEEPPDKPANKKPRRQSSKYYNLVYSQPLHYLGPTGLKKARPRGQFSANTIFNVHKQVAIDELIKRAKKKRNANHLAAYSSYDKRLFSWPHFNVEAMSTAHRPRTKARNQTFTKVAQVGALEDREDPFASGQETGGWTYKKGMKRSI